MTRLRVVATQDTAPGLIDQTAVINAPVVTQTAPTQNLTLGLVDQTATIADPTVIQQQFYTPDLIDQTATIADPTITTANAVVVALIDQTATISAPTVALPSIYAAAILADIAPAYYRLGDGSGPTVTATVGNNLTAQNSPTFGAAGLLTDDANTAMTFVRASLQYAEGSDSGLPSGTIRGRSRRGSRQAPRLSRRYSCGAPRLPRQASASTSAGSPPSRRTCTTTSAERSTTTCVTTSP